MNLSPYVFDVDYVTKIRSELSITVLEKKIHKITAEKKRDLKTAFPNLDLPVRDRDGTSYPTRLNLQHCASPSL